ncbi:hypothetical protein [Butyrivibrio sp. M55]|uniref:hypothetical protein n=1 Tax=Butyrivibrio sp. M55 TaxID=1855323 RepID=UPI0008E3759B|nr:hypothetical protein [Butyrivibrio sp. M55]SFU86682.1 hypothetical protein SAMN05216540_11550 [Butyrivibrio sp. M55]
MFDRKDLNCIDREYFQVISETCYHITLKSKNTGHTWDITSTENPYGKSIVISHKHNDMDPFHIQPRVHPRSIQEAQDMIKAHDIWQLGKD